jgi:signal transduction histidine kinase
LQALQKKVTAGKINPLVEIEQLLQLTQRGIQELRGYIAALRTNERGEQGLVTAVQRFAARFAEAAGIEVQVETGHKIAIADQWTGEIVQMVNEGLSNIRRHTRAHCATIRLESDRRHFVLTISNDQNDEPPAPFQPCSLTERARALGGQVRVDSGTAGRTTVVVEIPL